MRVAAFFIRLLCGAALILPAAAEVAVSAYPGVADHKKWPASVPERPAVAWTSPAFVLPRLPFLYDAAGSRADWVQPVWCRMEAHIALAPPGQTHDKARLLVRSRGLCRVWIDDQLIAELPPLSGNTDGHDPVAPVPPEPAPGGRRHAFGDVERIVPLPAGLADGTQRRVVLDLMIGSTRARPETGEPCLAVQLSADGPFHILGDTPVPLTDDAWETLTATVSDDMERADTIRRRDARQVWTAHFEKRHALLRAVTPAPSGTLDDWLAAARPVATRPPALDLIDQHCASCHGGTKSKGGLNLMDPAAAQKGGKSGHPALIPGDVAKSTLLDRLRAIGDDDRMPPEKPALRAEDIASIEAWIAQGAPWEAPPIAASPLAALDDAAFHRRAALQIIGLPPTAEEWQRFTADPAPDKRARLIDSLLDDPRAAAPAIAEWQDLLAEYPNILKPSQNNTGPFRYWLEETFRDHRPMDEWAAALTLMSGSPWHGGAAGFSIAADNDSPMAEKAHVLTSAFLGTQMKCARCHDAPFHAATQRDLFSLAALLEGKPLSIPKGSRVPAAFFEKKDRQSQIRVSHSPDEKVNPAWPWPRDETSGRDWTLTAAPLPPDFLTPAIRSRLIAAEAFITDARFAPVMANRVWLRYFGWSLLTHADDWESTRTHYPEVLANLSALLIHSGFDERAVARAILNSRAWQRASVPNTAAAIVQKAPLRRRLSAEQVVDTLWAVSGQRMSVEALTFDNDGRRGPDALNHLGTPRRAWEMVSLSNERDRPALSLPRAQAMIDVLGAFGWRSARAEPVSTRESAPHAWQSGLLANGTLTTWITRATPGSLISTWAREPISAETLVARLFHQFLGRDPRSDETRDFLALLQPGYEERIVPVEARTVATLETPQPTVGWTNHLVPEATRLKLDEEKRVRRGPPPDPALRADWRERLEDAAWALINSPDFVALP